MNKDERNIEKGQETVGGTEMRGQKFIIQSYPFVQPSCGETDERK